MLIDYVIMCGGYGSRLKPFTYLIPKPFLTTNNISPFDYSLTNIIKTPNVGKIFISAFYKKDFIKKVIIKKNKKIKKLKLLIEKEPMGTAGCLKIISEQSNSKHFIVINGDIFFFFVYYKLINYYI